MSHSFRYRLLSLVSRLPMPMLQSMAKGIAALVNQFKLSKTAQFVHLNLKIALPELTSEQQETLIQQAIRNEVMSYFEFFRIWGAKKEENLKRLHHVYGAELFQKALDEKKGVVLIVPHFGTWEIMNTWCAQHTQMTILYKPVKNKVADQFVRDARSREQAHLVPTNEIGVKEVFKALKKGGTTVILPDHSPNIESDMVDYFDVPLYSSNLSAKLIQKTKAKALFLYAMRNDQHGFDMYIEPISEEIYHCSANEGTGIIHRHIETLIRRYPEHYHWSYKRFKANPLLEDIYHLPIEHALIKIDQIKNQKADV